MNNEEKILQILMQMQSDISELKTGQQSLETKVDRLEAGQKAIESKIEKLSEADNGILDIVIKIDEVTTKHYAETQSSIGKLTSDINIMEQVAGKNLIDIATLKAVK